jgi:para-nitrobenzyl esterase
VLDGQGHDFGNYGLMDQQAALHGCSAASRCSAAIGQCHGGWPVGRIDQHRGLVISPASAGLFHRAIFESGPMLTVAPRELAGSAAPSSPPPQGAARR